MAEEAKSLAEPLPGHIAIFWQDAISNIQFAKQQQWRITNYVLILLAGLYGVCQAIQPLTKLEMQALLVLVGIAAYLGAYSVHSMDKWIRENRVRLKAVYTNYFTEEDRSRFNIKLGRAKLSDYPEIGSFLILVIAMSAIVAFYMISTGKTC